MPWRLFYLDETAVERFFIAAQQERLLSYHAAGSVILKSIFPQCRPPRTYMPR